MPEGLGRTFNVLATGDAVEVNCAGVGWVAFLCTGTDTYTVRESTSAAGAGVQDLAVVTRFYQTTSAAGAAVWTKTTQAAAAACSVTTAGIIEIDVKSMSDGFTYLQCNSSAAGLVTPIVHDLTVQRDPRNLPALAV